jgi:hypothetical protein
VPADARFCPACGQAARDEEPTTVLAPVPLDETGPVPVSVVHAQAR